MSQKVRRNYLEISSLNELKYSKYPLDHQSIELVEICDFQLNKFFYKNVGKKHYWVDRLIWTDQQWIDYIHNPKIKTYVLKKKETSQVILSLFCIKRKTKLK